MAGVTWLGDEDPSVQTISQYGHVFVKGVATAVPDTDAAMAKLKGNQFFSVKKNAAPIESEEPEQSDPDAGTEIAAVKAELDARGVKYRANASIESLRKLLADAVD